MKRITITELSAEEFFKRLELIELKIDSLKEQNHTSGVQLTLLTPKEVCNLLKIGHSTLHKYVKDGVISKYGISGSGKVLFKMEEIERLLVKFKN